jgi:hypothetical protein
MKLKGLADAILFILIGVSLLSIFIGYFIHKKWGSVEKIESETILSPSIKLIVKDNKIDTIYIYKIK